MRGWNYEKAKTALANYENVVNHYGNKGLKLDLTTDKGKKKYFEIRQKFWDICGNMKLIGEDIYCEMKSSGLPIHYKDFKAYLQEALPGRITEKRLNYIKKMKA